MNVAKILYRRVGSAHQISPIVVVNGGQCPPYFFCVHNIFYVSPQRRKARKVKMDFPFLNLSVLCGSAVN